MSDNHIPDRPEPLLTSLEVEYASDAPVCAAFCSELKSQVQQLVSAESIALALPIQSRLKTWSSIAEKLQRVPLRISKLDDLQDLIGVRIVPMFRQDVESIARVIQKNFEVLRQYDTGSRLQTDQFGYSSLHIVVKLREEWLAVPTMRMFKGLKAEIQVRTLAQHTWAEASQILQYKQERGVPAPILRSVYRLSALLETVDLELDRILAARDAYRDSVSDPSSTIDQPLNVDNLAAVASELLPLANKTDDEGWAELLIDLMAFGVANVATLRELISVHEVEARADEERQLTRVQEDAAKGHDIIGVTPDRFATGVYYTHVGLIRTMMLRRFGDKWEEYMMHTYAADESAS